MRRIVMLTGATSGLGLAIAEALANERYELILTYRDPQKRDTVLSRLQAANPKAHLHMVRLDLASFDAIEACAAAVRQDFDRLDVLFNNAGLYSDVPRKTAEGAEMTLGVNFLGPYYLTRCLLPLLEKGNQPQIIQMGSISALLGHYHDRPDYFERHPHGYRAYLNSKCLQLMMTIHLAKELKPRGITVNAVHPGVVATGIWQGNSLIMRILRYRNQERYLSPAEASRSGLLLVEDHRLRLHSGLFFGRTGKIIKVGRRLTGRRNLDRLRRRTDDFIISHGGHLGT